MSKAFHYVHDDNSLSSDLSSWSKGSSSHQTQPGPGHAVFSRLALFFLQIVIELFSMQCFSCFPVLEMRPSCVSISDQESPFYDCEFYHSAQPQFSHTAESSSHRVQGMPPALGTRMFFWSWAKEVLDRQAGHHVVRSFSSHLGF